MTVETPFPLRPPTPFWDPKGPMGGIGDVAPLVTTALNDATAAYIATQQPSCPAGTTFNPQVGTCQPTVSITAGGNGLMILLLIGAAFFFMRR